MSQWNAWSYCFFWVNICLNHSRCIHEIEFGSVGFIYCDLFKIWKLYRLVNRISVLPMEYVNRLKCKCPLTHRDSLSRIMHGIQTFVYIIEIQRKQWYKINMSIEHWKYHGVNSNYTSASPERIHVWRIIHKAKKSWGNDFRAVLIFHRMETARNGKQACSDKEKHRTTTIYQVPVH